MHILIEFTGFLLMLSGLHETMSLPLPDKLAKGGNYQFLTNISLFVTIVFFVMKWIYGIKRLGLFYRTIFDIEFLVTTTYWTLILFFPDLLNSDSFAVSLSLDLKIHFLPYALLLLLARDSPKCDLKRNIVFTVGFIGVYWAGLEVFVQTTGSIYPYPFLNNSTVQKRLGWMIIFSITALTNRVVDYLVK